MVVYYEKEGDNVRNILAVEHEVMTPTLPANMDAKEQIAYYRDKNMDFVSLPYEMGGSIFDYRVCVNDLGQFIGLQPIIE